MTGHVCPSCGAPVKCAADPLVPRDVNRVIDAVCFIYGIGRGALLSADRHKTIAEARQVAIYLTAKLTRASQPELGLYFNRDHSTAAQAIRRIGSTENQVTLERLDRVLEILRDPPERKSA